jgi:hypothetical protein
MADAKKRKPPPPPPRLEKELDLDPVIRIDDSDTLLRLMSSPPPFEPFDPSKFDK